ncbi:MAG: hypothetical protein Q7S87_03275 [Agitococcus sp.]|nr:hypothetical protein [Agitococcus sp.]MDO9178657.1 hypothetical protein [Agitococcus sp.]
MNDVYLERALKIVKELTPSELERALIASGFEMSEKGEEGPRHSTQGACRLPEAAPVVWWNISLGGFYRPGQRISRYSLDNHAIEPLFYRSDFTAGTPCAFWDRTEDCFYLSERTMSEKVRTTHVLEPLFLSR